MRIPRALAAIAALALAAVGATTQPVAAASGAQDIGQLTTKAQADAAWTTIRQSDWPVGQGFNPAKPCGYVAIGARDRANVLATVNAYRALAKVESLSLATNEAVWTKAQLAALRMNERNMPDRALGDNAACPGEPPTR